jgi:hypothetical protein
MTLKLRLLKLRLLIWTEGIYIYHAIFLKGLSETMGLFASVASSHLHSPRSGFSRPQDYAYQPLLR